MASSDPAKSDDLIDSGLAAVALLGGLADGAYGVDGQWRIVCLNDAACATFGALREDMLGKILWKVRPQLLDSPFEPVMRRVMRTRAPEDLVAPSVLYADVWISARVFPMLDGIGVTFRDVTARERTEAALAESEMRLRLALEGSSMGDWSWDAETDLMTMPARTRAIFGIDGLEVSMKRDDLRRTRLHPDDEPTAREYAVRAMAENGRYDVEYRVRHRGGWRWLRIMSSAMLKDGRVVGMHGLMYDITDRRLGEERLRRAHQAARAATWEWDLVRQTLTWTDLEAARVLFGPDLPDRQTIAALEWLQLIHPERSDEQMSAFAAQLRAGVCNAAFRLRGEPERWIELTGQVVEQDSEGRPTRLSGITLDITTKRAAEEALRAEIARRERAQQHQRLLIHELNHRVKNTLAMVQAIAGQTLWSAATPQEARAALESRLLALSRAHDVLTRESWDGAELSDVIASAVAPHEPAVGRRFRLSGPPWRLEPKTAVSLTMALHELATNAMKYGALTVEDGWIEIDWSTTPGDGGSTLKLEWREHDGPPVSEPSKQGFGSRLISRSLSAELGHARMIFAPTGLRCEIVALLPDLSPPA